MDQIVIENLQIYAHHGVYRRMRKDRISISMSCWRRIQEVRDCWMI